MTNPNDEFLLHAWTPTTGYKNYPPYINITMQKDGSIRVLIRGHERESGGGSPILELHLDEFSISEMCRGILHQLKRHKELYPVQP